MNTIETILNEQLIGSDEPVTNIVATKSYKRSNKRARNQLRQELRAKLPQVVQAIEEAGFVEPGRKWYDRYEQEKWEGSLDNLKDMPHSADYAKGIDVAVMKCDEAAARAANISDTEDKK